MKKIYTLILLLSVTLTAFAQAPQGFNYQATVRNNTGNLLVNQNVYFKFNVMQGSSTSLPVFTETHYVPTDDLGAVNLVIGEGTATTGVFSEIDWSLGSYYLGIELDSGTGYVAMGTTQLLSVPYALYAAASGNTTTTIPNLETVLAENNSANNQQIKNLLDPTEAQDAATKSYVDAKIPDGESIGDILTWNGTSWGIAVGESMLPSITTNNISNITSNSAETGGIIYDEGGSEVIARGVCYSSYPNPTLDDNFTLNNAGSGDFTSIITNLNGNSDYYVRAYATNSFGTSYGSQKFFATLQQPTVNIGEPYQGGIVAYIFQPEDPGYVAGETHGLIASVQDLSSGIFWGDSGMPMGSTAGSIGLGLSNTTTIVNALGAGQYAAKICDEYIYNGYNDWFLPSTNELIKIYENKESIGGFSGGFYWASERYYANYGLVASISFSNGTLGWNPNDQLNFVRACRYF